MIDISNLAPEIAQLFGINPATLVLLLVILNRGAELTARMIPNDATGWKGTVRKIAAVIGTYTPNRVTSNATSADIDKAAVATPPIPQTIAAQAKEEKAS